MAGKIAVEIGFVDRHQALEGIETKGVHGRKELDLAEEGLWVRRCQILQPGRQTVTDIQSFQFVAMNTGQHGHFGPVSTMKRGAAQGQAFSIGEFER